MVLFVVEGVVSGYHPTVIHLLCPVQTAPLVALAVSVICLEGDEAKRRVRRVGGHLRPPASVEGSMGGRGADAQAAAGVEPSPTST